MAAGSPTRSICAANPLVDPHRDWSRLSLHADRGGGWASSASIPYDGLTDWRGFGALAEDGPRRLINCKLVSNSKALSGGSDNHLTPSGREPPLACRRNPKATAFTFAGMCWRPP